MAKKVEGSKVSVSQRALVARINRKLKKQGEELRASRNEQQKEELGDYFTVETGTFGHPQKYMSRGVLLAHVKLEKIGRELGVLQPWEAVAE